MESMSEIFLGLVLFFTLPWVIFSLGATLADVCVGYIDEWLLHKFKTEDDTDGIDAPGQLILISGLFGLVTSIITFILVFLTPLEFNFSQTTFLYAFSAGVLEVLWLIPYFYAINRSGALDATPLLQSIPIFSLIFGIVFFNEIPALAHIVAAFIILSGAFLLNYSPDLRKLEHRTIALMLSSSVVISLGYFLFKDAAIEANFASALFGNGLGMGFLSLLIWMAWKPYRDNFLQQLRTFDKKIIALQTANEGLYAFGALLNQFALVIGPSVMLVSAMNAFHPIFTLLIGMVASKLSIGRYENAFSGLNKYSKIIAILAIAAGTVLISIS